MFFLNLYDDIVNKMVKEYFNYVLPIKKSQNTVELTHKICLTKREWQSSGIFWHKNISFILNEGIHL